MKGLMGAPCWWGAWGPGLLVPPLKSGPDKMTHVDLVGDVITSTRSTAYNELINTSCCFFSNCASYCI